MDITGASQIRGARPNWVKKSPMDTVVDDVIDSEDKYKRNLENCVRYYIGPLRRQALRIGLSEREVALLISNFEDLAVFHARTMFPALSHRNVVEVWLQHMGDLKRLYTGYMSSFAESIQIQAMLQSNAEYRKFVQGQRMERTTGYLDLTSYLQFPVSRVTAYAKFVLEIVKLTPGNAPKSQKLVTCFDQLREIAEAMDKVKREVQADLQSGRLMTRVRERRGDPNAATPTSNASAAATSPRTPTTYRRTAGYGATAGAPPAAPPAAPRASVPSVAKPALAPPIRPPSAPSSGMSPPPAPPAAPPAGGLTPPPVPPAAVAASAAFRASAAPSKPLPRLPQK